MINPWKNIDLKIYESHMALDNICQLQALNVITRDQLRSHEYGHVAILGIAGGNGLEHIDIDKVKTIYGFDVNEQYIEACRFRYPQLIHCMELACCDLSQANMQLPESDLLICNLIIEYLGVKPFTDLIKNNKKQVNALSCVIQKNMHNSFVSHSEYTAALEPLSGIHHDIDANELTYSLANMGFLLQATFYYDLPNGKEFIRLDFKKS